MLLKLVHECCSCLQHMSLPSHSAATSGMDAKRPLAAPRGSGASSGPPSKRQNGGPDDGDARFESFELDAEDMDERLMEEDLEVDIGEAGRNWERPPAPDLDPITDSISEPHAAHESGSQQHHKSVYEHEM